MYVYFIRAERLRLIKIGRAERPKARLANLRSNSADQLSLLGVIKDVHTEALELRLHRRFAAARSHGEWFRQTRALLRYIEEHAGPEMSPSEDEEMARRIVRAFGW